MRNPTAFALIAILASSSCLANPTLTAYSPACLTEDLAGQFTTSLMARDMDALGYLLSHGCLISDQPLKVTVLGLSNWGGFARIRVYRGNHAVEAWTGRGNLSGYDPLNP